MIDPHFANSDKLQNTVWQVLFNELCADMVQMRCEVLLQQHIWFQQQQQLLANNQFLLDSLLQMELKDSFSQAQLLQLKQDYQHDALTQTLTRTIMLDRINHAISVAKRQHSQFALLFIDLDKFKPVNDQYGHAAGDAILQQVSQRLTSTIRASDAISRHGGDEFLLLLTDIKCRQDVATFALKLLYNLTLPYQVADSRILLSASIGIALYPEHSPTTSSEHSEVAKSLISYADAAMYRSKQQGGAAIC